MHAINRPEVIVASVDEKIDEKGNLTDGETRKRIRQLLESLVDWTKRLKKE
jgi:chromate reductase